MGEKVNRLHAFSTRGPPPFTKLKGPSLTIGFRGIRMVVKAGTLVKIVLHSLGTQEQVCADHKNQAGLS